MKKKNYKFSPSLASVLAMLALVPMLIGLGMWQLDRADEKRAIEARVHAVQFEAPLGLNKAHPDELLNAIYSPADAVGKYDGKHQFLYDNRTHEGRPGYHVLTPFVLQENDNTAKAKPVAILVNRGWIPYIGERDNIEDISVDSAQRLIKGTIKNPSQSITLDEINVVDKHFPQTIQRISVELMAKQLGYEFYPVVLELKKSEKDGFVRDWKPFYGSVDKHNAYALQWFTMAAVLLVLFFKYSFKKVSQ